MAVFISGLVVVVATGLIAETQAQDIIEQQCDPRLTHRLEDCPQGYCCVRDEFLPTWVYCRKSGLVGEDCTTRDSETNCPCKQGLTCKPNVVTQGGAASLYGRCLNLTKPSDTTTTTTTRATTTTTAAITAAATATTTAAASSMTQLGVLATDQTPCPQGHSCENNDTTHETHVQEGDGNEHAQTTLNSVVG